VVYAPTAGLLEALEGTSNQICEGSASVTTTMVKASYKSLAHLNLNTASENDGAFQLLITSSNCWDSQQEDKQLREKSKLCRSELFGPANSLLMALCGFKQCPTSMTLHQTWTIHQHFQTCPKQFTIYTYFNIISHISLVFISKSHHFWTQF